MNVRGMMRSRLGMMIVLALLALALGACSRGNAASEETIETTTLPVVGFKGVDNKGAGAEPGMRAPDFVMQYPDGRRVTLADFAGQPVVMNFWATWCAPCKAEMPELVKAYNERKESGLVILGVNEMETEERALQFAQEYDMEFPLLLDSRGELARIYLALGLPTTVFIDRDGVVRDQWRGILTPQALNERLDSLLEN